MVDAPARRLPSLLIAFAALALIGGCTSDPGATASNDADAHHEDENANADGSLDAADVDASDGALDVSDARDSSTDADARGDGGEDATATDVGYRLCDPVNDPSCTIVDSTTRSRSEQHGCPDAGPPTSETGCSISNTGSAHENLGHCYYCRDMKGEEKFIPRNTEVWYCDYYTEKFRSEYPGNHCL